MPATPSLFLLASPAFLSGGAVTTAMAVVIAVADAEAGDVTRRARLASHADLNANALTEGQFSRSL